MNPQGFSRAEFSIQARSPRSWMRFAESCPRGRNRSTRLFDKAIALRYSNWHTNSKDRQGSTVLTASPRLPAPFVIVCRLTMN